MRPLPPPAVLADLGPWPVFGVTLGVAVGVALVVHAAVYAALHRMQFDGPH